MHSFISVNVLQKEFNFSTSSKSVVTVFTRLHELFGPGELRCSSGSMGHPCWREAITLSRKGSGRQVSDGGCRQVKV